MNNRQVISLTRNLSAVLLLFFHTNVFSQGGDATFPSCNKLAVYELKQCLDLHGVNDNQHCWTDSHLAYQQCHFAMNNRPKNNKLDTLVTKAELKKVQQLSKRVRAKTIKILLMGAANMEVYKQVVMQSADNLNALATLKGVDNKQRKQSIARHIHFQQLFEAADSGMSCAEIKTHLGEFAQQHTDEYNRSAYREIKTLLPIYCRL